MKVNMTEKVFPLVSVVQYEACSLLLFAIKRTSDETTLHTAKPTVEPLDPHTPFFMSPQLPSVPLLLLNFTMRKHVVSLFSRQIHFKPVCSARLNIFAHH